MKSNWKQLGFLLSTVQAPVSRNFKTMLSYGVMVSMVSPWNKTEHEFLAWCFTSVCLLIIKCDLWLTQAYVLSKILVVSYRFRLAKIDCFISPQQVLFRTRSSADADNRLDAFSGQSRSTNMVPFHMLHIVSYCAIVTSSLRLTSGFLR